MKQLKQVTVAAVCSQGCTPKSAAVDFLLDIIADAVVDISRDTIADAVVDFSRDTIADAVVDTPERLVAADCSHD
jgi:hypothetical protein